jgi:hypothetical protein
MPPRIPAETKALAKRLYFDYEPVAVIAKATKLSPKTIDKWIYGKKETPPERTWKKQRENKCTELMASVYEEEAKHNIARLFQVGVPMIVKAFEFRAGLTMPLTMEEAVQASQILTSFDKLRRLDQGRPTDIVDLPPVTLEELRDVVVRDKFFDVTINVQNNVLIQQGERDGDKTKDEDTSVSKMPSA